MAAMKPNVVCKKCDGTGTLELSAELYGTFKAVGSGVTVSEVIKRLGWSGNPTAINNRLEDLRGFGLLTRTRIGRQWRYSKTGK